MKKTNKFVGYNNILTTDIKPGKVFRWNSKNKVHDVVDDYLILRVYAYSSTVELVDMICVVSHKPNSEQNFDIVIGYNIHSFTNVNWSRVE